MTTTSILPDNMKKTLLYRAYTATASLSATLYLPPTQFQVGVEQTTPTTSSTALTIPVPITDGTVCDDGSNTMTGTYGADDSTDNISVYKEGAGVTDVTAQNLITTGSNLTKRWAISNLAAAGVVIDKTQPFSNWLYIKDATALAKFATSGTAFEVRLGSGAPNCFSKLVEVSELATGWNYITSNLVNVEDLPETGTVGANIDYFALKITTNLAADAFIAGDVVYDLLRQWATTDLYKDFQAGYPSIDYTKFEATSRGFVPTTQCNGFPLSGFGTWNEDTTKLLLGIDSYDDESKSGTDEFTYIAKDRLLS